MNINYLAVLVCAIVAMPVGFLWFGPLFGKAWARHMGFGDMQPGALTRLILFGFILSYWQ